MIKQFTLKKYEYLKNSIYGNPKILAVLEDEHENIFIARTKTNASICYCLTNYYKEKINIQYHFTKTGNMILDRIIK